MAETANQFPDVWGRIDYVFQPGILSQAQVREEFTNEGTEQIRRASQIRDGLASVIDRVQSEIGLQKVHILEASQEERDIFVQALKSDREWLEGYADILKLFGVENDPQSILPNINRPWWNSLQVNLSKDSYQAGIYSFKGPVSHSFIAQLKPVGIEARTSITPGVQERFQPLSVGVVLHTSDRKIVLGYRGGANFSDTLHLMPVGSAEPHLDRGTVWGSFEKESLEELNLVTSDYKGVVLVAKTLELMPAKSGWHYLVFRAKTKMTSEQVANHWEIAVDRKEHRRLEFLSDEPDKILNLMKANLWNPAKADPMILAKTTLANYGKFLPQCVLGILASYVQDYGEDFAKDAEQYFDGHFDLTSCFK